MARFKVVTHACGDKPFDTASNGLEVLLVPNVITSFVNILGIYCVLPIEK